MRKEINNFKKLKGIFFLLFTFIIMSILPLQVKGLNIAKYDITNQKNYTFGIKNTKSLINIDGSANKQYGRSSELYDKMLIYALNLLDDDMSETEKAIVLAQFTQLHDGIPSNRNSDYYGGSYPNYYKKSTWYNKYFHTLATTAGLSCEILKNENTGDTWNICNLDDEWTYIDTTKSSSYPTEIKFDLFFKSKSTIEKNPTLKNKYDFENSIEMTVNKYYYDDSSLGVNYNPLFDKYYPDGVDKKIDNYSSLVYYDTDYKYYEKTENNQAYIYKENRKTHEVAKLQEVLNNSYGSGLVKNNDNLYYVGTDNKLYTYNLKTNSNQVIESLENEGRKITDVYLNGNGKIGYKIDGTIAQTEIQISDWPVERTYSFDNDSYKYNLVYVMTPKNVTIVDIVEKSPYEISGELNLPDEINSKPVVGILANFGTIYGNKNVSLTGDFIAPKDLEYIGVGCFQQFNQAIKLNSKLKSIGANAFAMYEKNEKMKELVIPDSVTYMGESAFKFFLDVIDYQNIKFSSNLKYLSPGLFYNRFTTSVVKVRVPEKVEYVGSKGIPVSEKVYFFPKNVINVADNLKYALEVFYWSEDTKFEASGTSYYITPDFRDKIILNLDEYYPLWNKDHSLNFNILPRFYYDEEPELTITNSNSDVAYIDGSNFIHFTNLGETTVKITSSHGGEVSKIIKVVGLTIEPKYLIMNNPEENYQLTAKPNIEVSGHSINEINWNVDDNFSYKVVTIDNNGKLNFGWHHGFAVVEANVPYYGTSTNKTLIYVPEIVQLADTSEGYLGDLYRDGNIDEKDVILLEDIIKKGNPTSDEIALGNVNQLNDELDEDDLKTLKEVVAEHIFKVPYAHIEKIEIYWKNSLELNIGDTYSFFGAPIYPDIENAPIIDTKVITWTSSNDEIVKINQDGEITALKTGSAIITATTSNGKVAKCVIIVGNSEDSYILGDLNENGVIEVVDAIEALKYYVELQETTPRAILIGDFNNNAQIDVSDAVEILKLYVNK